MKRTAFLVLMAMAGGLGMLGALPARAQTDRPAQQQADVSWHHQMLYRIMKDMTQEMGAMAEQMSRSDLTADQREQMGQRMKRTATMMERMSGLAARPAMANPESQRQMELMRKQMDEMMRDARMTPEAR
jgi:hypothetical protein